MGVVFAACFGLHPGARQCLAGAVSGERRGGEDPPGVPGAGEQHPQVVRIGEVVRADRRPVERVGRLGHDRAAALRPGDADDQCHAGFALEPADRVGVVAPGGKQQLQVGARQPLAAAAEDGGTGDAEGKRALADGDEFHRLRHQPAAA